MLLSSASRFVLVYGPHDQASEPIIPVGTSRLGVVIPILPSTAALS